MTRPRLRAASGLALAIAACGAPPPLEIELPPLEGDEPGLLVALEHAGTLQITAVEPSTLAGAESLPAAPAYDDEGALVHVGVTQLPLDALRIRPGPVGLRALSGDPLPEFLRLASGRVEGEALELTPRSSPEGLLAAAQLDLPPAPDRCRGFDIDTYLVPGAHGFDTLVPDGEGGAIMISRANRNRTRPQAHQIHPDGAVELLPLGFEGANQMATLAAAQGPSGDLYVGGKITNGPTQIWRGRAGGGPGAWRELPRLGTELRDFTVDAQERVLVVDAQTNIRRLEGGEWRTLWTHPQDLARSPYSLRPNIRAGGDTAIMIDRDARRAVVVRGDEVFTATPELEGAREAGEPEELEQAVFPEGWPPIIGTSAGRLLALEGERFEPLRGFDQVGRSLDRARIALPFEGGILYSGNWGNLHQYYPQQTRWCDRIPTYPFHAQGLVALGGGLYAISGDSVVARAGTTEISVALFTVRD